MIETSNSARNPTRLTIDSNPEKRQFHWFFPAYGRHVPLPHWFSRAYRLGLSVSPSSGPATASIRIPRCERIVYTGLDGIRGIQPYQKIVFVSKPHLQNSPGRASNFPNRFLSCSASHARLKYGNNPSGDRRMAKLVTRQGVVQDAKLERAIGCYQGCLLHPCLRDFLLFIVAG